MSERPGASDEAQGARPGSASDARTEALYQEMILEHYRRPRNRGAVALAAAVDYLERIGMERVLEHERKLLALAQERVAALDGIRVFGPPPAERSGVLSFTMADVHPHDLATILDEEGVCIRAGHHCAQPLMRRLGVSATARASFYVYNDERDVDALVRGLKRAAEIFAGV